MISEQEALSAILKGTTRLPTRSVPLDDALPCYSAVDLYARLPLPVFDNSAMDGYAVIAGECSLGCRLRVVGEQPAGRDRRLQVRSGEAVRIYTGAPLPSGADAVVMQEDTQPDGEEIAVKTTVGAGEFVRRRGSDLAEGQKILGRGEKLTPQLLALLAAEGFSEVSVGGTPRVAIVSTGDELAAPGAALQPGQIYESNSTLLAALLRSFGFREIVIERCSDEAAATEAALARGAQSDVLIISGGVSVGPLDLVKPALAAIGGGIDVWRVSVKPGKPFLFGRVGRCVVFGLPGNPVSAFVTFLLFVRPALLKMAGATDLSLSRNPARLRENLANNGQRPHYVRGRVREGRFEPVGLQESHALYSLSRANALVCVAPGETLSADSLVEALTWGFP